MTNINIEKTYHLFKQDSYNQYLVKKNKIQYKQNNP